MLKSGENIVDGVKVAVVRRRAKRISLRVLGDGSVRLTVPFWWATIAQGAEFLARNWDWVLQMRQKTLANPSPPPAPPPTEEQLKALFSLISELHTAWVARLGETGTTWRMRRMRSRWGVCDIAKRRVTYSTMLACRPREQVEYIVVHELTHLKTPGHGAPFKALMDARLPGWRDIRRRLNHCERPA